MKDPHSWRFINTGHLDGRTNMAVDGALLGSFDPDSSPPVFRLYGWDPPAVSLGSSQKPEETLNLEECRRSGVAVVRRFTGGGMIYHCHELTYSLVCAPAHLPPAGSVKESFRLLTGFLLHFYRTLHLPAEHAVDALPAGTPFGERTPCCFAGTESFDIMIRGRKMGGNAQRRLRNVIFQHGSIPVENMAALGARFLKAPPAGLTAKAGALREFGIMQPVGELERLLAMSFAAVLPARLHPDGLSAAERQLVLETRETYDGAAET